MTDWAEQTKLKISFEEYKYLIRRTNDLILMVEERNKEIEKLKRDGKVLSETVNQTIEIVKYQCPLCQKKVSKLVRHHYSYYPEKIILVCSGCNSRPNLERDHPHLNPPIEDADRFYNRENKKHGNNEVQAVYDSALADVNDDITAFQVQLDDLDKYREGRL